MPQGADCPGRTHCGLERDPGRDPHWVGEARPALTLSPTRHRHVRRQDQGAEAGVARAPEQIAPDLGIARRVELEPAVAACQRTHGLRRRGGNRGQAVGHADVGGDRGQDPLAVRPHCPRHADRRDPDRQGIAAAEQFGLQVRIRKTAQDRRTKPHRSERLFVQAPRAFVAGGAVEILPDEARHAGLGAPAQIGDGGVGLVEVHMPEKYGGCPYWDSPRST